MSETDPIQPSEGVLNSITDIRKFFEDGDGERPFQPGEFIEFWKSLTDEEKTEFMNTPLK